MREFYKIKSLVKKMKSKDTITRFNAIQELYHLNIHSIDINLLKFLIIEAATSEFQESVDKWDHPSYFLIEFVARYNHPNLVDILPIYFKHFDKPTKELIFDLFLRLDTDNSIDAFIDLFEKHAKDDDFYIFFDFFEKKKEYAHKLFPRLNFLLSHKQYQFPLFRILSEYLSENILGSFDFDSIYEDIFSFYKEAKEEYLTYDKDYQVRYVWSFWKENYFNLRSKMITSLFLMRYYSLNNVEDELKEALTFCDPIIRTEAISSLLFLNEQVEESLLFDCAKNFESRVALYYNLENINKLDLYPKEYFNQKAFVESDMNFYLLSCTDFNHVPNELEVLEPIEMDNYFQQKILYYPCKFRSDRNDWEENGWMLGISGEYLKDLIPTPEHLGGTYSDFESFENGKVTEKVLFNYAKKLFEIHKQDQPIIIRKSLDLWTNYSLIYTFMLILFSIYSHDKTRIFISSFLFLIPALSYVKYLIINRKFTFMLSNENLVYQQGKINDLIPTHLVHKVKREKKKTRKSEWFIHLKRKIDYIVFYDKSGNELLSVPYYFCDPFTLFNFLKGFVERKNIEL